MSTHRLLAILTLACASTGFAAESGFALKDTAGKQLDVSLDGRTVARYMYEYDKSTSQRLLETYKPYLHVFDAAGEKPITKGPGGLYTHHRGIFIGFSKMKFGGKSYDRWHMKGGEIVHQKFSDQKADADQATFTSQTQWRDENGKPMIVEDRTTTVRRGPSGFRLAIGFVSKLTAPNGEVTLDGDPEHAGIQYRPANELDKKLTTYVFPKEKADPRKDRDLPWVGESYTLDGKRYSVVILNDPKNPKDSVVSAYRDYGRFGYFFRKDIPAGGSLTVRYGFLIADGEMPSTGSVQEAWDSFAGVKDATSTPKTTVVGSQAKGGK